MQEAELKHSRIAMVSVCLWPLSEMEFSQLQGELGEELIEIKDIKAWVASGVGVGFSVVFGVEIDFC